MALVVKDRIQQTSTTTSTGTYTLSGSVTGYQDFSAIGDGNTTYYAATNGTDWEVGIGTYTASGTTLSRDTILASSNSGNAVNWGAGTKNIFVTYPAGKSVLDGGTYSLNINGTVGATTPNTGAFTTLSASGVATFAAGSVSAPALTTSGDTNTGIYFSAADSIGFSTGGVQRFLVDNAGITTNTDVSAKIIVGRFSGSFTDSYFALGTGSTGYTFQNVGGVVNLVRIDSSGNVGIGTSSPGAKLDVLGSTGIRAIAATTQDAVIVAGRAGGTSSRAVTLTPTTLTASRTLTLPDETGTVLTSASATILREIATQTFGSSTTYTIPTGAKVILVECISAGGGGGGGARNISTSTAGGGGGGAGGGYFLEWVPVSLLSSPVTVTIGAGGAGAAGRTGSTGNGSSGQRGGLSRFGTLYWVGGGRGIEGTTGGGGQGGWGVGSRMLAAANKKGEYGTGGIGGSGSGDLNGRQSHKGGGGGGGGGNATAAAANGGAGGASSTTDVYPNENSEYVEAGLGGGGSAGTGSGGAGGAGTASAGGGGGASNRTGTGGAGGNGASPGGGGGGGGGGNNNNNGGDGGTGGNAQIKIWVFG